MKQIAIFLLSWMCLACSTHSHPQKQAPTKVYALPAQTIPHELVHTFSGVSEADIESKLSFRVPGRIEKIYVSLGQQVFPNQPIAKIDPQTYALSVEEAQFALIDAQSGLRKAQANYERVEQLYETQSSSRADLDAARTSYESSKARVELAQTQLSVAHIRLEDTLLTSPVRGYIAKKIREENENVVAGETIVWVHSDRKIRVTVPMPENLIQQISFSQKVSVKFTANPSAQYSARVYEIAKAPSTATTYPVTVELEELPPSIRSGMSAEVLFTFPQMRFGVLIPAEALFVIDGESAVFVIVSDPITQTQTLHTRFVTVSSIDDQGITIEQGLEPQELVVALGVSNLHEGQHVQPIEEW